LGKFKAWYLIINKKYMETNIIFLSGLPRTGSTLLTSILNQNPKIHTQGNSALCQLLWDTQVSIWNAEQIKNTPEVSDRLMKSIPKVFYEGITGNIIDKCRSWTLPANLELIEKYITKSPKIIVMMRPIVEIVKSITFIRTINGWKNPEEGLLDEGSEPIMRSLEGIKHSKSINSGQFAYYWYEDLVNNTDSVINSIYEFCGWDKFEHQYNNIQNLNPERDDLLNLMGLHDIRPKIGRREIDIKLSDELYKKAKQLDKEMWT
jgi:sulfotransferase